jgi:hypothetical protein
MTSDLQTIPAGATRSVRMRASIAPGTPSGEVLVHLDVAGPTLYAVPYWNTASSAVAMRYRCSDD